jgi:hypothetical protein
VPSSRTPSVFEHSLIQKIAKCHGVLTAQLHRIQHEIVVPLIDCAYSRIPISVPYDDIITTARGVRRACLYALRGLYERLCSPSPTLFLPPPRFSVQFCPFALQLQKESSSSRRSLAPDFQTKKVRPHDRHDEREICPHCSAHISVPTHSGLPAARRQLFQAHVECRSKETKEETLYACSSCYKTFEDAYSYLDHAFQKQIGSERSCLKRWNSAWNLNQAFMESDPALVEKCLKNCLNRELMRIRAEKQLKRPDLFSTRCDSVLGMRE